MSSQNKMVVAIVCGGTSSEHEVSCISASGVLSAIDRELFDPIVIGIKKSGGVVKLPDDYPLSVQGEKLPTIAEDLEELPLGLHSLISEEFHVEIVFPVLHGSYGEDGEFQKECEALNLRYVGSGVEASALAMEKGAAKRAFSQAGLNVVPGVVINKEEWVSHPDSAISTIEAFIDGEFPIFVKPSRSGSSRGTHKVKSLDQLKAACDDAFTYDTLVLIEKAIDAREIECAVLDELSSSGNRQIVVSPPGEIKISEEHEFYDFESKYLDGATSVEIPAAIDPSLSEEIRKKAMEAFLALDCLGYARVDFFLDRKSNELYINEINTIPGFTPTSVYPLLMKAAGVSYRDLITALLTFASL